MDHLKTILFSIFIFQTIIFTILLYFIAEFSGVLTSIIIIGIFTIQILLRIIIKIIIGFFQEKKRKEKQLRFGIWLRQFA
jgi:hypothetical protein